MADTPQIQGSYVSWANINLSLESYSGPSFQTSDISALDWEQSLEPTKVQGTGPIHRARTIGMFDSSASMSMYYDKAVEFQAALQSSAGRGYMLVPFDIVGTCWSRSTSCARTSRSTETDEFTR